jgi:glycosyltransferase involved in cell wall biosynthesis
MRRVRLLSTRQGKNGFLRRTVSAPLLGIAIPTYKRPDQLRRCLLSIVRSIRAAGTPEVPIHVADDSCDETNVAVLAELRQQYPHLFHHRNPKNLGIDGNILHSVDLCQARYAWLMGEDDRMTPEAIPALSRVVASGERPFVYVNYASIDEDVSMVLAERSLALERDVEMDADEFFATCAWSMSFIGACVVRKDLWSAVPGERYLGTYYAHVGRILEYLRGGRAYLVARPLVLNRCGTPRAFTWMDSSFDVLNGWSKMVDLLRGLYPEDVCDEAAASFRRARGIGTIRSFCYLRADGALHPAVHEKYVRHGPYPALNRRMAWWIARTPPALFKAVRWGLMTVRRARNRRLSGY